MAYIRHTTLHISIHRTFNHRLYEPTRICQTVFQNARKLRSPLIAWTENLSKWRGDIERCTGWNDLNTDDEQLVAYFSVRPRGIWVFPGVLGEPFVHEVDKLMRLSDVAFTVQATLLLSGAFSAFQMNKFGNATTTAQSTTAMPPVLRVTTRYQRQAIWTTTHQMNSNLRDRCIR